MPSETDHRDTFEDASLYDSESDHPEIFEDASLCDSCLRIDIGVQDFAYRSNHPLHNLSTFDIASTQRHGRKRIGMLGFHRNTPTLGVLLDSSSGGRRRVLHNWPDPSGASTSDRTKSMLEALGDTSSKVLARILARRTDGTEPIEGLDTARELLYGIDGRTRPNIAELSERNVEVLLSDPSSKAVSMSDCEVDDFVRRQIRSSERRFEPSLPFSH